LTGQANQDGYTNTNYNTISRDKSNVCK